MGGGYGNIKAEDGKPFVKGNQAAKKWTEEKLIELGEDLINWLLAVDENGEDVGNIIFEDFLIIHRRLNPNTLNYLNKTYTTFSQYFKHAKKIQEIKLQKYGLAERVNAQICKFLLSAKHNFTEKKESKKKVKKEIKYDVSQLSTEELIQRASAIKKIDE